MTSYILVIVKQLKLGCRKKFLEVVVLFSEREGEITGIE